MIVILIKIMFMKPLLNNDRLEIVLMLLYALLVIIALSASV
ncbi:hypothetical protein FSS13T_07180 [Flavobacterium saliperosum S13]|uniref:Uncharacterized protein n=1 Tax=Flavobacterium saliperosum S13 TaxID=1341155 RepID=A0ABN0QIE7_9FLAO|nr:hypothetical protein FSS13T_07180 [Flavobacterium saliperosum S13]